MTGPDAFFGRLAARATGRETTVRPRPAQPYERTDRDAVPTVTLGGHLAGAEPEPLATARLTPPGREPGPAPNRDRAAAPTRSVAPGAARGSAPAPGHRPSGTAGPSSPSARPRPRPSSAATVPDPVRTTRPAPGPAQTEPPPRRTATTPPAVADGSRDRPRPEPRTVPTDLQATADGDRAAGRPPEAARPSDGPDRPSAQRAGRPAAPRRATPARAAGPQVDVERLLREHVVPAIVGRGVVPSGERVVVADPGDAARRPAPRPGTADLTASAARVGPGRSGPADPGGSGAAAAARAGGASHDPGPPPVQVTIDRVVVTRAASPSPPPTPPARQPRRTVDHAAYLARRREGR